MKAEELMVGDWVQTKEVHTPDYYKPSNKRIVSQIKSCGAAELCFYDRYGNKCYENKSYNHIEPIPLDCEIMWKNGFEDYNTTLRESWKKCSDFTARSFEHPMEVNERYAIVKVMFQENSFGVEIHTGKPTEDLRALACDKSATSNMRYVHELQHALRLCGIEKDIVL